MQQLPLPGMQPPASDVVNIASVKHRSPFRYPGGKTWLVPRIYTWLQAKKSRPAEFIEPFAGGAIVGLSVAFEQLAERVTLVELDEQVAAVWQTVINRAHGEWLAQQILDFDLTPDNVNTLLSRTDLPVQEAALQTIVKNRVNHGGILASGAGKIKHGENGRGLRSRWYPETLVRRIRDIVRIRERLHFIAGDGIAVIEANQDRSDIIFFIDPPYTASSKRPGSRLYNHAEIDHEKLFALLTAVQGDFLLTYDNADEIQALVQHHGFDCEPVAMKNTHHARLSELLIGRDLSWLRNA